MEGRSMRGFLLLSMIGLGACAGGPAGAPPSTSSEPQSVTLNSGLSRAIRTNASGGPRVDTLWASFDRIWKTLPGVFGTLEIPIANFDAERNVIGNQDLKLYRRLGKTPLTRLLDCGTTQVGPNAESYEVRLSVQTTIQRSTADTSHTALTTTVQAMARPMAFAGEYRQCTSKGALEEQLLRTLVIQLQP
jgi:hypothetical protein